MTFERLANRLTPELLYDQAQPIDAGHMLYQKHLVPAVDGRVMFVKAFDESLFTDPKALEHTRNFLIREGRVFMDLRAQRYPHLPRYVNFENETLVMSALLPERGWRWDLPNEPELQRQYVPDVLDALATLEQCSVTDIVVGHSPFDQMLEEGWSSLQTREQQTLALQKLEQFAPDFLPHVDDGVQWLKSLIEDDQIMACARITSDYSKLPRKHLAHLDARQSNIAWHPNKGVRLVDWSWASPAPAKADRTMFLIDLHKSGYNVDELLAEHFDIPQALTLMGYWLARAVVPPSSPHSTVRFHQMASAVSAASLLSRL